MDQRHDEEPVCARGDPDPVVSHSVVSRAHRVDADNARTTGLELADANFDGVAVVVLCDTEDHEHLGAVPVGLAKFPEGTAHGIDTSSGHIDRAEAAVCGIVGRAEGLRPERCEALRLVASCKEGELFGGVLAQRAQPAFGEAVGFVPADLFKLTGATWPDPFHRSTQARGRIMLHDARRAFGAEHTLVYRVIFVALDILYLAVLHMHVNPAAAGTHVASGFADLVGDMRRRARRRFARGLCLVG